MVKMLVFTNPVSQHTTDRHIDSQNMLAMILQ